jgi:uncharacterized protein YkwD
MAFERLRAHGAVVSTVAVMAVAGVSVASLAVAQGRLKEFDRDTRSDASAAAAVSVEAVPPSPAPADSTTTTTTAVRQGPPAGLLAELFSVMNADRAARGLAPLAWDQRLAVTAQQVSDTMAESQVVAPKDLSAILELGYTRAGENVVTTPYGATAASIEYGWMGSSSSRATIVDSGLQHVGIGATSSRDGRVWITVDFGGSV